MARISPNSSSLKWQRQEHTENVPCDVVHAMYFHAQSLCNCIEAMAGAGTSVNNNCLYLSNNIY